MKVIETCPCGARIEVAYEIDRHYSTRPGEQGEGRKQLDVWRPGDSSADTIRRAAACEGEALHAA